MHPELSERDRFPLLTERGRRLLHRLAEDEHAPIWNWPCGDQLDAPGLERVHAFARRLGSEAPFYANGPPGWVKDFAEFCLREVPFYRRAGGSATDFTTLPTISRADAAAQPWAFVPDSEPLDRLIVFKTSGTTGHPAAIPCHPATAACGLPLLERALAAHGVQFRRGPDQVALMNVCAFEGAFTGPLVLPYLEEAGYARVNLLSNTWRKPDDRERFLDRWRSPVLTADPISLTELLRCRPAYQPQAVISSSMTLSPALGKQFEEQLGCPVLDVYALTEVGILAVRTQHGHEVLPPDVYVEVLDDDDNPCSSGAVGEVTLTGGRNPFFPLLRYRTGDFAALEFPEGRPVLVGLEGRPPCTFRAADGRAVQGVEVSRALCGVAIVQFGLHQESDGTFRFRYRGPLDRSALEAALRRVFGAGAVVQFEELPDTTRGRGKIVQYTAESGS